MFRAFVRASSRMVARAPRTAVPRSGLSFVVGQQSAQLWKRRAFVGAATAFGVGLTALGGSLVADSGTVDYAKVRQAIIDIIDNEPSHGPLFVRLAWHASGTYSQFSKTGGSNGATMRFAAEAGCPANAGLHIARNLLEPIKKANPGITYADLWTLAGATAIEAMGGPAIPWRAGRSDQTDEKLAPPTNRLPDADVNGNLNATADHVRDVFGRMGFNDRDIVALLGAHTLGRCHPDRSGYSGPWTHSPETFSNSFYVELFNNDWKFKSWKGPAQYQDKTGELMMLPADLVLIVDPVFRKYSEQYAKDEKLFFRDFAAAFSRMLELGVPFNSKPWYQFW